MKVDKVDIVPVIFELFSALIENIQAYMHPPQSTFCFVLEV